MKNIKIEEIKEKIKNVGKTNLILVAVFVAILIIFLLLSIFLKNEKQDMEKGLEIASVNGKPVYEYQIQERLKVMDPTMEVSINSLPENILKAVVLEMEVNNQINKEAKKLKYQKDPEIQEAVKNYEEELIREKFLNEQIYSNVSESDAKKEYDNLTAELGDKEERKIKHILVETENEIERVRRAVVRSKNFEKSAKSNSIDTASGENGGDIGYVLKEELVPEFGEVAFVLKVGEVSKPVQTQYGWHIIKVEDIRKAQFLPFEEVKEGIIQQLQQDAIQNYLKDLTGDIKVELNLNNINQNNQEQAVEAEVEEVDNLDDESLLEKSSNENIDGIDIQNN